FATFVTGEERTLFEARVREIQDVGADDLFSRRLITLRFLDQLLEVLDIARETEADPLDAARAYYRTSELFDVPWLRRTAFATVGDDPWEHRAAQALSEDLSRAHRRMVVGVMRQHAAAVDAPEGHGMSAVDGAVDTLLHRRKRDFDRFRGIVDDLKGEGPVGFAAVSVVAREMSALADRIA